MPENGSRTPSLASHFAALRERFVLVNGARVHILLGATGHKITWLANTIVDTGDSHFPASSGTLRCADKPRDTAAEPAPMNAPKTAATTTTGTSTIHSSAIDEMDRTS
jgi:hypothetical protein